MELKYSCPKCPGGPPPEHAQVGFICHVHDLEASTSRRGDATAEPFLLQTWPPKVAPKQFDHGKINANLTHLPLIS